MRVDAGVDCRRGEFPPEWTATGVDCRRGKLSPEWIAAGASCRRYEHPPERAAVPGGASRFRAMAALFPPCLCVAGQSVSIFGMAIRKLPDVRRPYRFEFHVSRGARDGFGLVESPFTANGTVIFADWKQARTFAEKVRSGLAAADASRVGVLAGTAGEKPVVRAGDLNAMALIHEVMHAVLAAYRDSAEPRAFELALAEARGAVGPDASRAAMLDFCDHFPPRDVYTGLDNPASWLDGLADGRGKHTAALEEMLLLRLDNENPAFAPYRFLFDDRPLREQAPVDPVLDTVEATLRRLKPALPGGQDIMTMLRAPMRASPGSLAGQLAYIRLHWGALLGDRLQRLLGGMDMLDEENRPHFPPGPGPSHVPTYSGLDVEYERFSEDRDWMPRVVMMAKSTLVWLDQLSKSYGRHIRTLDQIPDEELDILASRGFNALWLIGLWERSNASSRIKQYCGNPEAAPSAYSLFDYEIAWELGGWQALESLRHRAQARGIRLAADMVPNHTGLDSSWIRDRPDLFLSRPTPPFPSYTYNGGNLSDDGAIGLWLEDHYYNRSDAAVTFKRVDFRTGDTRYIYHGNDGTTMPWNDTAQIDFLNPAARDAVKERILHVARNFPIIRFDAAMVLAKRSIRRLWYPEPGAGGAIASRFESAIGTDEFNARIPEEFWREVVDMCAAEAPDTLLLAEAFWMMEGYFVRTLGMHRVYNSAFMNMLKAKKNAEYRATIRNTIEFDKDILKRFVNFMNNPDEDTAVAQFGNGDQYFGVCTLMATMPGLPMFGHGQVEGFSEKYGMEYRKAYHDEIPDATLVHRHEQEIFPLLKRRYLFSGVEHFLLYDMHRPDGSIDQNVYAYSNGWGRDRVLVLVNNEWERTHGTIRQSCQYADKRPDGTRPLLTRTLAEGLGLSGAPGLFVRFIETRSGLWFLRRSDSISRDGLAVALEGFQSQVFMGFAEFEDDSRGSWTGLHDLLGGRGVPDLAAALVDLRYAELYTALGKAYPPAYFSLAPESAACVPDEEAIRVLVERIVVEAGMEPMAAAGAGSIVAASVATAAEAVALAARRSPAPASIAASDVAGLSAGGEPAEAAGTTGEAGGSPDTRRDGATDRTGQAVVPGGAGRSSPLTRIADRLAADPAGMAALAALAPLVPFGRVALAGQEADSPAAASAASLVDRWQLERKLAEAITGAGLSADASRLAANLACLVFLRPSLSSITDPEPFAEALASDSDLRAFMGVHEWDGIEWFNAERYRLVTAVFAAAAVVLGGRNPQRIVSALDRLDEAATGSGWRLQSFMDTVRSAEEPYV